MNREEFIEKIETTLIELAMNAPKEQWKRAVIKRNVIQAILESLRNGTPEDTSNCLEAVALAMAVIMMIDIKMEGFGEVQKFLVANINEYLHQMGYMERMIRS